MGAESDKLKESITNNNVIRNVLIKKFEQPTHIITGFENESYSNIDSEDLKIGLNIVSYDGGKIIIEKITDTNVRPRTDLPIS